MSFKQINLPTNISYKQELLDPRRMLVSPIWCGHQACLPIVAADSTATSITSIMPGQPWRDTGHMAICPVSPPALAHARGPNSISAPWAALETGQGSRSITTIGLAKFRTCLMCC
eukprot:COSAG03_NODE_9862_length_689_cov_1.516949_1_plen_114_part_10